MPALIDHLAAYVLILEHSADHTHRAEDRLTYTQHLASAARMFRAANGGELAELKALVKSERHAYGWGFLSDAEGAAAERAFAEFADIVERWNAA